MHQRSVAISEMARNPILQHLHRLEALQEVGRSHAKTFRSTSLIAVPSNSEQCAVTLVKELFRKLVGRRADVLDVLMRVLISALDWS